MLLSVNCNVIKRDYGCTVPRTWMYRFPSYIPMYGVSFTNGGQIVLKWGCEWHTTPFRGLIRRVGCTDGTFEIELRHIHIHAPNYSCTPVPYVIQV